MPVLKDDFLVRFSLAGGPWAENLNGDLEALRAENPARFDELRATYEAINREETERVAREQALAEAAAQRSALRARRKRLEAAGAHLTDEMTEAVIHQTHDHWEAVEASETWWTNRQRPWLVLSGTTGCGKTVSAAALIATHGGLWLRSDDAVRVFAGFFGDAFERQQAAKKAPLLVLEDVGTEQDPARMLSALLELLDERISTKATPTIVTTNYTKAAFAKDYNNTRLHSRLAALSEWVFLTTPDMRRQKAVQR